MKKLLLPLLIMAGVFGYQHFRQPDRLAEAEGGDEQQFAETEPDSTGAPMQKPVSFRCDGREYCSQMTSYEEAVFFLRNCPGVKMDGDNDGVPCERQFNK